MGTTLDLGPFWNHLSKARSSLGFQLQIFLNPVSISAPIGKSLFSNLWTLPAIQFLLLGRKFRGDFETRSRKVTKLANISVRRQERPQSVSILIAYWGGVGQNQWTDTSILIFHQCKPTKHETDELNMKLNQFHKSAFGQSFCFIGRIRVWTAPYHTLMILKYFYKNGMVVYCAVKISYMQFTDKIVFFICFYIPLSSARGPEEDWRWYKAIAIAEEKVRQEVLRVK